MTFLSALNKVDHHSPTYFSRDETPAFQPIDFSELMTFWKRRNHSLSNIKMESFLNGVRQNLSKSEIELIENARAVEHLASLSKSIRITNLQLFHPGMKEYCESFYTNQKKVVTANLYFTPNNQSQCFVFHPDPQLTFVTQLYGHKKWTFLENDKGFIREKFDSMQVLKSVMHGSIEAKPHLYEMSKGDWIVIPYCMLHKAENLGAIPSVHITFSYHHPTMGHFLRFAGFKALNNLPNDDIKDQANFSLIKMHLSAKEMESDNTIKEYLNHFLKMSEQRRTNGQPY